MDQKVIIIIVVIVLLCCSSSILGYFLMSPTTPTTETTDTTDTEKPAPATPAGPTPPAPAGPVYWNCYLNSDKSRQDNWNDDLKGGGLPNMSQNDASNTCNNWISNCGNLGGCTAYKVGTKP
jgi:hypothetical protein